MQGEVWRLLTTFVFFGKFSFGWLMSMFILLRFGSQVEAEPYRTSGAGGSVDYAWCLVMMALPFYFIGWCFEVPLLGGPMLYSVVYLWGCLYPENPVSMWGIRLKGAQLPWGLAVLQVLTGSSPVGVLMGIFVGHLFYFFADVYPRTNGGQQIIKTPVFFINMADAIQGRGPSVGQQHQTTGQHNWGAAGQRLGGN